MTGNDSLKCIVVENVAVSVLCCVMQYGSTAAHLAALHGHELVLRSLIDSDVSVRPPDAVSSTACFFL